MKRIAFTLFVCFFASLAFSQNTRGSSAPPPSIKNEFAKTFPDAEAVKWNSPRRGYSASFFLNGYPMIAYFSEEGEWESTHISIPEEQVPEAAMKHFEEIYEKFRITETVYHDAIGNSYYCLFIAKGPTKRELHYTDDGEFIREVK